MVKFGLYGVYNIPSNRQVVENQQNKKMNAKPEYLGNT